MNCENARVFLMLQAYGELSFDEEENLDQHLDSCPECSQERARIEKMFACIERNEVEPPAGLLARCRRDLATSIAAENRPIAKFSPGSLWRNWVVNPPMWLRPMGAVAMLAMGFFAARWTPEDARLARLVDSGTSAPFVSRVRLVNPDASGRVRVLYDEVRQREMTGAMDDDSIRRLLLAAATDPGDPGLRVESMDILKMHSGDEDVRRALLNALRSDTNSGVRLKALEGLKAYARDPETRKVLSQVLLSDENPGVRTMAIDLLVQNREPEVAGVLQELMRREQNGYVRSKSEKALNDMKASQGTF